MRIVAVSLALLAWVYLSGAAVVALAPGCARPRNPFLSFVAGVILTHTLLVIGAPLGLFATALPLGAGALLLVVTASRRLRPRAPRDLPLLGGLGLATLPVASFVARRPLEAWDARSIWFFHAKMVFHGDGLHDRIGLREPALVWSHPDYPKLIANLGALSAELAGFWNEHVPKVALIVLLIGMVLGIAQLRMLPAAGRVLLLLGILLLDPSLIGAGYADLWLAGYACLAQGYLVSYLRHRSREDLAAGVLALAMLPLLKNEGTVLAAIIAAGLGGFVLATRGAAASSLGRDLVAVRWLLAVALAPVLLWSRLRARWGLENDLDLFSSEALARGLDRWDSDASVSAITEALVHGTGLSVFAAIAALAVAYHLGWSARAAASGEPAETHDAWAWVTLPGLSALAYGLVLFLVFLMTPADLGWHLGTAAGRVALPVAALLMLSAASIAAPTSRPSAP